MLLRFTKMHGLGNDFMVLDLVSQHAHILPKHAKQWGDRHTGVGFDQLLIVEAPSNPEVDFRYRIFNSDGSEVEQCGNGARCFARFVLDKRLTTKRQIKVETKSGIIELNVRSDGQISVDMGPPRLVPADIPFVADAQALSYELDVDGQTVEIAAVSMGNPHAVLRVDDINAAPVHETPWGRVVAASECGHINMPVRTEADLGWQADPLLRLESIIPPDSVRG